MTPARSDSRLATRIESPLPRLLSCEQRNEMFLAGACWHDSRDVVALEIAVAGCARPAMAHAMPRPDLARTLGERAYRSGFWGTVGVPDSDRARTIEVELVATLDDGSKHRRPVGALELVPGPAGSSATNGRGAAAPAVAPHSASPRIAICMATYEPPLELLERQIESIRGQTNGDWACVISDDNSSREKLAALESLVAGDSRFTVSPSERRLGFVGNFERALRLAPTGVEFIALADQDDRWHPDKLDVLLGQIGAASIAYSDARIVTVDGDILSPTYWNRRRNNSSNFASLLLANTVSGSAALYRREVIDLALPFPPPFGGLFHDHWLAIVGLAMGEIAYVDRPLYDYVQHPLAALGHERAQAWSRKLRGPLQKARRLVRDPQFYYRHWRRTYFSEYCRTAIMARVLLMRCPHLARNRRRTLRRLAQADRSFPAVAWLFGRRLRGLFGFDETLRAERRWLQAVLWRQLVERVTPRFRSAPRWLPKDARPPTTP